MICETEIETHFEFLSSFNYQDLSVCESDTLLCRFNRGFVIVHLVGN